MSSGDASRLLLADLHDLAAVITRMPANAALALGALRDDLPDRVPIAAKATLAQNPGAIARSNSNIIYMARPGVVLLDHDTKGMPDAVETRLTALGGFANAVESVCPAFARAASVARRSTSCGIYDVATGQRFPGSNGIHLYTLVDAREEFRAAVLLWCASRHQLPALPDDDTLAEILEGHDPEERIALFAQVARECLAVQELALAVPGGSA
jgi:hypothetical protein